MRALLLGIAVCLGLTSCNKSSPPPEEPVKPRGVVEMDVPVPPLPAP